MNWKLHSALSVFALVLATQAAAQITFYENEGFRGRNFVADREIGNFDRFGFNDLASSVVVKQGAWEVCEDAWLAGRCVVLREGNYESLSRMGMSARISSVRPVDPSVRYANEAPAPVAVAAGQITLYEAEGFRGRTLVADRELGNFDRAGFNDRANSVAVKQGAWEVCEHARFAGRCVVLRPGNYESLRPMGMAARISSVRPVDPNRRYANEVPVPVAAIPAGQITFYENEGLRGRTFVADKEIGNFDRFGFNDRAASIVVNKGTWEVCEGMRFTGRCVVLRPGNYASLTGMDLNARISSVRPMDPAGRYPNEVPVPVVAAAAGQITFYEDEGFRGQTFVADRELGNFERFGFNDRASSVIVNQGAWEVCEGMRFTGRCVVLRRGSYDSLRGMDMNDRVSSVRPVDPARRYENEARVAAAVPNYAYGPRPDERVYQANVTSARAVMGPPNERCWMERQQVNEQPALGGANVPGAIIGAIVGGVLGHQVGGGRGKDIATVGGAVAGAAVGANVGRTTGVIQDQEVRRCESVASSGPPAYWDVTYNFQGVEHRLQMSAAPGPTIAVNANGEPRQ